MNAIRVYFGPMPLMLRGIMGDLIEQESDFLVVGTANGNGDCLRSAYEARADVVIAQQASSRRADCLDLLLANPTVGVFVVAPDARSASSVHLERREIDLDADGRARLTESIRALVLRQRAADAAGNSDTVAHPLIPAQSSALSPGKPKSGGPS